MNKLWKSRDIAIMGGRARPRLSWIDNINSRTGLGLDHVQRTAEAKVQWHKAVCGQPLDQGRLKTRQDKLSHVWQLTGTHVTVRSAQFMQEGWFCGMPGDQSTQQADCTLWQLTTASTNCCRRRWWRWLSWKASHNFGTLPASEATHRQTTYKTKLTITSGRCKTEKGAEEMSMQQWQDCVILHTMCSLLSSLALASLAKKIYYVQT